LSFPAIREIVRHLVIEQKMLELIDAKPSRKCTDWRLRGLPYRLEVGTGAKYSHTMPLEQATGGLYWLLSVEVHGYGAE
jgi:hypothetical protein